MVSAISFRTVAVAAGLLMAFSAPGPATAAAAADRFTSARTYLAAHPGGTILSDNEISYRGGEFVVTLRAPIETAGTADCPSGWYCFYDSPNFGYPRGRLYPPGRWIRCNNWRIALTD
ncbi:hypothetical protein [Micromonospora sp. RTGN7]|uniref:hypothetical protein n=1 Tax=Micromonospora sp. RTGN7 TaxID=3016526 RepID=UPI0029FF23B4|nr:hypothetical protein [Micromonospora sp. RTGN7]